MARKKSYNDLLLQVARMSQQAGDNPERQKKIHEIYRRYRANIKNSKSFKKAYAKEDWDAEAENGPWQSAAKNRKYSQATYMGNSNG